MIRHVRAMVLFLLVFSLAAAGQQKPVAVYNFAQLVRVVDGDTVRLDVEVNLDLWQKNQSCRLLRVDAPELPTVEGKTSAQKLGEFLTGKTLRVELMKKDSFGRWLIELYANDQNVSDWLLQQGLAKSYLP